MDVRQVELGADREFLDHELEVVVARQRHHRRVRICGHHSERGGDGPAEPGLSAVDPVARLVHVQELPAGDLREPNCADVAGIAIEDAVHFLVHPLRLDRTSSKCVLRCIVRLRVTQSSTQAERSGVAPLALRSPAMATNCSSAALASETMP